MSRSKGDPLYSARRTLHTGADLLTGKQKDRPADLFATDWHVQIEATWGVCQRMIAAYRGEDRRRGRELMVKLIDSVASGVPKALTEILRPGRTLKRPTYSPTSTAPAHPTAQQRRSTDDSNTSAAPRSGSAT